MKEFEYIGVLIAVVAYLLIVSGELVTGFQLGTIASLSLAFYFLTIRSFASVFLQGFFVTANIYGLINLGII